MGLNDLVIRLRIQHENNESEKKKVLEEDISDKSNSNIITHPRRKKKRWKILSMVLKGNTINSKATIMPMRKLDIVQTFVATKSTTLKWGDFKYLKHVKHPLCHVLHVPDTRESNRSIVLLGKICGINGST